MSVSAFKQAGRVQVRTYWVSDPRRPSTIDLPVSPVAPTIAIFFVILFALYDMYLLDGSDLQVGGIQHLTKFKYYNKLRKGPLGMVAAELRQMKPDSVLFR